MADEAEKTLRILRANLAELTAEVDETEKGVFAKADVKQRATLFGERITQDLLAVDGVDISKSKAEEALLKKDRKLAQKISVLLARRKRLIKDLQALAERVDRLGGEEVEAVDEETKEE